MSRTDFYDGMTILITGGSSGFGREFARQLAPHAGRLLLVALDQEGLDDTRESLLAHHPRLEIQTFAVDLADSGARKNFCQSLAQSELPIHFLINNAGLGDVGRFISSDPAKLKRIFQVNILALTALTHRVLPLMPKAGNRAILNVSSLGAISPAPFLTVYNASKAYVSSFTEALRLELRGKGITVTSVCPGPVDTAFGTVANRDGRRNLPAPAWLKDSTATVVSASLRAVAQNRARVFPGLPTAALAFVTSLIPLPILRMLLAARARTQARRTAAT